MRRDRWATSVVALAAVVALVLGAGVLSATVGPVADGGGARAAGLLIGELAPDATTTTAVAPPAPVPPASPAPRPGETPTTATTLRPATTLLPSRTPTTTVSRAPATGGSATLDPFPGADRRYQPGRKTWTQAGGGWSVTVSVDDPTPAVGEAVDFEIALTSTSEPCCGVVVLFDGAPTYQARSGDPCPEAPAGPGSVRFRTTVTFIQPGWKSFHLTANTGRCSLDPPRIGLSGDLEVGPRPASVQGPTPPAILPAPAAVSGHAGDRTWLAMGGDVEDIDGGIIRKVTVDWGDGSPLVEPPLEALATGCVPATDGSTLPDRRRFSATDTPHHYARAGSYVVTIRAYSTACDGRSMPQTGSVSLTWSTESGFGTPFG